MTIQVSPTTYYVALSSSDALSGESERPDNDLISITYCSRETSDASQATLLHSSTLHAPTSSGSMYPVKFTRVMITAIVSLQLILIILVLLLLMQTGVKPPHFYLSSLSSQVATIGLFPYAFNHSAGALNAPRPPRVAHCLLGHARTFWMHQITNAYRTNVMDRMHDAQHDVYLVSDYSQAESHGNRMIGFEKDKYNMSIQDLNVRDDRLVWLNEVHNFTHLLGSKCGYSNFAICKALIERDELAGNFRYTHIMRSRPDLLIVSPMPTVAELPIDRVLVPPYYECAGDLASTLLNTTAKWKAEAWCESEGTTQSQFGINDMHAVGPRDLMISYLDTHALYANVTRENAIRICGERIRDCECQPKAVMVSHNITYEPWPMIAKIRRPYDFCRNADWNKFNSWC